MLIAVTPGRLQNGSWEGELGVGDGWENDNMDFLF